MEQLFTACFASMPADWHRNNPIARYEGYYASVFYANFAALGLDLAPEDSSNAGRLDLAMRFNGQVYLFEFKVVEFAPEGRALQQIKDLGYAEKFRVTGQPVHLIGVAFSRTWRNIVGFESETLVWKDCRRAPIPAMKRLSRSKDGGSASPSACGIGTISPARHVRPVTHRIESPTQRPTS